MNTDDWIVANIRTEGTEVIGAILKPLNAAPFCPSLFKKCGITLIMSATILKKDTFCHSVGIDSNEVKFIQVGSDFPTPPS